MADIIVTVYKTRVVNGVVQADSELVTLTIPDSDNDGLIDPKEWSAVTGGTLGHDAGNGTIGLLWSGDKTGSLAAGYLYSADPYTAGQNVSSTLSLLTNNFSAVDPDIIAACFTPGTRIDTPNGPRLVETIAVGDLVRTRDHGAQPVVWVGRWRHDAESLDLRPELRPIRIKRGALGDDLPRRGLWVSAQHRMVVGNHFAPARRLLSAGWPGVKCPRRRDLGVTYIHLAFAAHEIVFAEGAPCESFHVCPGALRLVAPEARASLIARFPLLSLGMTPMPLALPEIRRRALERRLIEA